MKKRAVLALALLLALTIVAIPITGVEAQETLIWSADVPSNGGPVTSPVLEAGKEYRIDAKGWFISCDVTYGWVIYAGDAQFYTDEFYGTFNYGPTWAIFQPAPGSHSFLQIDGMDVNWGPFSNVVHEYSISYTGTGAPITFTIVDWIDEEYTWNFCHIRVEIYEGPPTEEGKSPGYWKHQFLAYYEGKGKPQETWADLVMWASEIDAAAKNPPTPWDLPPLAEIDWDGDGTFTTDDAYHIFKEKRWLSMANWYNWAADYGQYS